MYFIFRFVFIIIFLILVFILIIFFILVFLVLLVLILIIFFILVLILIIIIKSISDFAKDSLQFIETAQQELYLLINGCYTRRKRCSRLFITGHI